jgi:hypothetical protein
MSQWALVIISYGLTVAGTIGLGFASFVSMRRAEREATALKDRT